MDKLKGIESGDRVEVTFQGVVAFSSGGINVTDVNVYFGADGASLAHPSFSIKKAEPPIAVGDRVEAGGKEAEVRAIVDGFYVLNSTAWEFPQVWCPENVKRA
jgi:hypothetical protein